ncbi:Sec-independent protein translocase protein TatB [Aliikangiella sp. G2MR2-5]|uniref:Sec-independent protein translocase protein TatB n=1 Tax=Aliikangiella sp. G2MR2-5 TaxID=2788943 RepID=UPI0018AC7FAF|nr:Sec-independent protein translocase protein TatB [Aliikangiella sp. G2MR2-5]
MFDMGFLELLVVGVIALIVLGPERLPKAARTVGMWVGKAKQSFNSIKTEIDRELKVQELQQQIKEQQEHLKQGLGANELQESLNETQSAINSLAGTAEESLNQTINLDVTSKKSSKPVNSDNSNNS